jgi:acetyltransferase-like isoleucine patch superfamily enzyme
VFIGPNATILMGVNIGDRAVISAGAVVTADVPEQTIVAGVPARAIGRVDVDGADVRVVVNPR